MAVSYFRGLKFFLFFFVVNYRVLCWLLKCWKDRWRERNEKHPEERVKRKMSREGGKEKTTREGKKKDGGRKGGEKRKKKKSPGKKKGAQPALLCSLSPPRLPALPRRSTRTAPPPPAAPTASFLHPSLHSRFFFQPHFWGFLKRGRFLQSVGFLPGG